MKTYWDLTKQQRVRLTRDEVEAFCDQELMQAGVLRPDPWDETESPLMPELGTDAFFEVGGVIFKTLEQAQAFLDLAPMKSEYDYSTGYDYKYVVPISSSVETKSFYRQDSLLANQAALAKVNSRKEARRAKAEEYEAAHKKIAEATIALLSDYDTCLDYARQAAKIQATFDEYLTMCDGDEALAKSFLAKVFEQEEVDFAEKWQSADEPAPLTTE